MTVESILAGKGREVETIEPHHTLAEAVDRLASRRIGAVVVTDPERRTVLGILSERDIVRALAKQGASALDSPLSGVMTSRVVTCRRESSINDVMEQMSSGKFRHVPVVEEGRLAGIVSIGDIVKQRLAEVEAEHKALRDYIATA